MEAVQGVADAKEIELEAFLDPDAGPLLADPDRLQQVVWNLLSNAIKFSPVRGHVGIRLERAGSLARITVSDRGAASNQQAAFAPRAHLPERQKLDGPPSDVGWRPTAGRPARPGCA